MPLAVAWRRIIAGRVDALFFLLFKLFDELSPGAGSLFD
jgi:hypothetical protein